MIVTKLSPNSFGVITARVSTFFELLKPRLSLLVACSCAFGYTLAGWGHIHWLSLYVIMLAAFLVSGGAVCINQIIERNVDKLMKRTQNRPIPTHRVSVFEATLFAVFCLLLGMGILWKFTNTGTILISLVSLCLYAFVYTPLKRIGPFAVFVGAIPGALPPLLGWVAATGQVTYEAWLIFSIQFIWQFPHFWSIAWVADEDYRRAGFKLLPSGGGKNINTAIQIMVYTLFLIPISILPAKFGMTGIDSAIITALIGMIFFAQTFSLMWTRSNKSAVRIMISSFLYLPLVWISFLWDKIN